MATTPTNHDNLQRLHYGKKDWFIVICGLNDTSLVPSQTLTKKHISNQDCIEVLGDQKANNGYKVGKNSKYRDRVLGYGSLFIKLTSHQTMTLALGFAKGFYVRNVTAKAQWIGHSL